MPGLMHLTSQQNRKILGLQTAWRTCAFLLLLLAVTGSVCVGILDLKSGNGRVFDERVCARYRWSDIRGRFRTIERGSVVHLAGRVLIGDAADNPNDAEFVNIGGNRKRSTSVATSLPIREDSVCGVFQLPAGGLVCHLAPSLPSVGISGELHEKSVVLPTRKGCSVVFQRDTIVNRNGDFRQPWLIYLDESDWVRKFKGFAAQPRALGGFHFTQLVAHHAPLPLRIFRIHDAGSGDSQGEAEHSYFRDSYFREPIPGSAPAGYVMEVCGALALFLAFGAVFTSAYGLSSRNGKLALAGVVIAGLLLWLSVFLIHRGLDLIDKDSEISTSDPAPRG